jgi:hypothetical protein
MKLREEGKEKGMIQSTVSKSITLGLHQTKKLLYSKRSRKKV